MITKGTEKSSLPLMLLTPPPETGPEGGRGGDLQIEWYKAQLTAHSELVISTTPIKRPRSSQRNAVTAI